MEDFDRVKYAQLLESGHGPARPQPKQSSGCATAVSAFKVTALLALLALVGFTIYQTVELRAEVHNLSTSSGSGGKDQGGDNVSPSFPELAASMKKDIDASVNPCDDFYQYACGTWMENTELPADKARITRSFDAVTADNEEVLREILEDPTGSWPMVGPFYQSCMDTETRNKLGNAPLSVLKEKLASFTKADLMTFVKQAHAIGVPVLFSYSSGVDQKAPENTIGNLAQGGFNLPTREIYIDGDDTSKTILEGYSVYLNKLWALVINEEDQVTVDAAALVKEMIAFETALAKISMDNVALRDPESTYNKMTVAALQKTYSALDFASYFGESAQAKDEVNVVTKDFFKDLAAVVDATSATTLKYYLLLTAAHTFADDLTEEISTTRFDFEGKIVHGQSEDSPLWARCVRRTDAFMGELLGRYFVAKKFGGDSKAVAQDMINRIEAAFKSDLTTGAVEWLSAETVPLAEKKLSMVENKIGYPDTWRDYSAVPIIRGEHFANVLNLSNFATNVDLKTIGKPTDKNVWQMTPATVNAYYEPSMNEMVFPAGIMQEPFFNATLPRSFNFGGMGSVMGHELTHGFDDQGRQYDGTGKLTEWWDQNDVAAFKERAQCATDLYSSYEVQDGLFLNGELTLGENIADMGGMKKSFRAYRQLMSDIGEEKPFLEGHTNEQLFFLSYGQMWCGKMSPMQERLRVATDPHSLPKFRVNGPLSQFDGFAAAYECPVGSAMNPEKKCNIW